MEKLSSVLLFLVASFVPSFALAHEKWFIKEAPIMPVKPLIFSAWTMVNAALVISAILALVAVILFHAALRSSKGIQRISLSLAAYKNWVPGIVRMFTGLLLFTASLSRFVFAPDLVTTALTSSIEHVFLSVELLIGLFLLIGFLPRLMGALGLMLYFGAYGFYPVLSVASYLHLIGVFIYIMIIGDPNLPKIKGGGFFPQSAWTSFLKKWKPYALPQLRIFAGLSFIFVGYLYKIFDPSYALELLRQHPLNFMPFLGFAHFSNEMFVLSAGITEIFLGVLILLGLLPRFVGAALIFLFTLTMTVLGVQELVGHLPLFAIAFMLLIEGGGELKTAER